MLDVTYKKDAIKLEFKGQPRLYHNVIAGKNVLGKAALFALKRSGKKLYGV